MSTKKFDLERSFKNNRYWYTESINELIYTLKDKGYYDGFGFDKAETIKIVKEYELTNNEVLKEDLYALKLTLKNSFQWHVDTIYIHLNANDTFKITGVKEQKIVTILSNAYVDVLVPLLKDLITTGK